MVDRVLDPLKVQKTNSSMNTDDDDDTISMMSFDDPVSFDDAVEEDMNLDNILQQQSFLDPVLPCYVPPVPTPVVGAELLGTDKNSLVVYDPPPWIPRPMYVTVRKTRDGGTVELSFQLYPYSLSQAIGGLSTYAR